MLIPKKEWVKVYKLIGLVIAVQGKLCIAENILLLMGHLARLSVNKITKVISLKVEYVDK